MARGTKPYALAMYAKAVATIYIYLTCQVEIEPTYSGTKVKRKLDTDLYNMMYQVPSDPTAPTPLKVGLLTVGSGRYARFFKNNTLSAENYLLREVAEMHYFVFTDNIKVPRYRPTRPVGTDAGYATMPCIWY